VAEDTLGEPGPRQPAPGSKRRAALWAGGIGLIAGLAGGAIVLGIERAMEGPGREPTPTAPTATTGEQPAVGDGEAGSPRGWAAVVQSASPGVVAITATMITTVEPPIGLPVEPRREEQVSLGSGFVLDKNGHVLTNQHVVSGATSIKVHFSDGTHAAGRLAGADATSDLAVIKVSVAAGRLRPVTLGSATSLRVGDAVLAIGAPFGYERSASAGIVSGLDREIASPNGFTLTGAIQTDAAVNHGNSGGPLLDAGGRAVGVNAQIAASGVDANVGVAFAVPIDAGARKIIAELRDRGSVSHAWLGVAGVTVDPELAATGRVGATSGVLVTGLVDGGPADSAGLQAGSEVLTLDGTSYCVGGDVITAMNGRAIATMADLQDALETRSPGDEARITVVRASGVRATVDVPLAKQPAAAPAVTSGC
jgi:S1-C subfamily serine protease